MKPPVLRISDTFVLPVDFVTWTQAILAKKGSGKSYTASVQAEELLGAEQQIVVVDPTGAWWGLRSSSSGMGSGYPIAVLGGEHGDVPLESTAGEVIADAIATEHFSAIIDLSLFRKGESLRFMATFLETLYRRNRDALHLFIDEADVVAPQKPFGVDEGRVLGATEDIVRRGRIKGIGCTLITQRPQVLNKNVLSQVDMLTALRMNHPKDIGAIDEWVAVHGDAHQAKIMMTSLPSLPIGDAWVWAPAQDILQRATIRPRRTFDSGRTPKAGERAIAAKVLAPVDIARLGATIAATAEQAKANNPKELRARVIELEKQLAAKAAVREVERVVEIPVITDVQRTALHIVILKAAELVVQLRDVAEMLEAELGGVKAALVRHQPRANGSSNMVAIPVDALLKSVESAKPLGRTWASGASGDRELGGGERKILTALAQHGAGRTKRQVAVLTGYAHSGGTFNNYISALRSKGYLEGESKALLWITPAGRAALGTYAALPTGRALFEHWLGELGKAEREVLRILHDEWPKSAAKEYVALKAGYTATGGGFNNALSKLRTLELIEGKSKLKVSDDLMGDRT